MINTESLYFSYTNTPPYVLKNINLHINKGDYISILGDNGCGKSTLVRLLLGFLKPTKGKVSMDEVRLGYVPQKTDFANASFPITVYEMLNAYRKLLKVKNKSAIDDVLNKVGMLNFKKSLMGNLSGGQHQKILIARALLGHPDLLILDEPSTGIDRTSQVEIYRLLKQMNVESQMTVIAVEHNLDAALDNSSMLYHMVDGHGHLCTPDQYVNEFLQEKRG